jgi:hypothetical protein
VHFPEGAISGYPSGAEAKQALSGWAIDWASVQDQLEFTARLAADLGLWVVVGSSHRLTPPNRPHNSLYVISDEGRLIGRYDKRRCSHTEITDWYSPGFTPLTFDVDGFRFGSALCIEVNFPELFIEYRELGVDCVLLSFLLRRPGVRRAGPWARGLPYLLGQRIRPSTVQRRHARRRYRPARLLAGPLPSRWHDGAGLRRPRPDRPEPRHRAEQGASLAGVRPSRPDL